MEVFIRFACHEVERVGHDGARFDLDEDILGTWNWLLGRANFKRLVGANHTSDLDGGHVVDTLSFHLLFYTV